MATTGFGPGTSTTIFTGTNTYTGGTEICQCTTLQLGNGGTTGSIVGDIALGGTLVFNRSNTYSFDGTISDDGPETGKVVQNGPGTLILTGTNSYSGGTTVNAGTLSITNGNAIGSGRLTLGQGTRFRLDGSFTLNNNITISGDPIFNVTAGNTTVIAGTISDVTAPAPLGVVEKTGAGKLVLSGTNTYSGGTVISAGILQANNSNAVGTGPVTLDGGTFKTGAANLTFTNNFTINGTGGTIDNSNRRLTLSGVISNGSGGPGQLRLIGGVANGPTILGGVNTYTGGTLVLDTTVQVKNNSSVGAGTVTLDGAEFQAGGANLNFSNKFAINNAPGGSAIDNNNRVLTLSGNIVDGNGPGMLTFVNSNPVNPNARTILTGLNSYTGGTDICSCAIVQLGDATHTAALAGAIINEGQFGILNADTTAITRILNRNGGQTGFFNTTSASTAVIVNRTGGGTTFANHSTAGGAIIGNIDGSTTFLNHSDAGSAAIVNRFFGVTEFLDNSSAASATILNRFSGSTIFFDNSTAGNATIINNSFGGNFSVPPVGLGFFDNSTAGTATIINKSITKAAFLPSAFRAAPIRLPPIMR
jgi:autotransporter-associated beta strand protein